jgi:NAD-dependent histone deacetylase SIR2
MFDISYFRDEPHVFYSFAREIFPSNFTPSPTHNFIKLLEDKGVLLRNYTQNIDTLEQIAGITNVLQCHGSFASASCIACGHRVNGSAIQDDIFKQQIPYCPICTQNNTVQNELAIMKPDIVFFGESLPKSFDEALLADREQVDLLVVMGSSLKVAPVSEIMGHLPHRIPQIVINKTPITHMQFDVQLLGDCDTIVPELCRRLGWELEHEQLPGGKASLGSSEVFTFHPPCTFAFQGAELPVRFLQQDE